MGMYLNIGNEGFESIRKGLYVDKSGLISFINGTLGTKDKLESLKFYIGLNEDGLKDAIILMLGGERYRINTRTFQNDMANIKTKDDALTLLVHLGYLAYDSDKKEVYIPNQEVADEFKNAVEYSGWGEISKALASSETLFITIAYYVAQKDYILIRKMPTGKGFADILLVGINYNTKDKKHECVIERDQIIG